MLRFSLVICFIHSSVYIGEGNGNTFQFLYLENPHGPMSLAGFSPWGHKESDVTECIYVNPNLIIYPTLPFLSWCPYICSLCLGPLTSEKLFLIEICSADPRDIFGYLSSLTFSEKYTLLSGSMGFAPTAFFILARNALLWDSPPCGAPRTAARAKDSGTEAGYKSLTKSDTSLPQTVTPIINLNPALAPRVDLDEKKILLDTTLICIGTECLRQTAHFQDN